MAKSLTREILKSVTTTSITSAMLVVSVIRVAMLIYPAHPLPDPAQYSNYAQPTPQEQVIEFQKPDNRPKPRIVFGQHSIENLK